MPTWGSECQAKADRNGHIQRPHSQAHRAAGSIPEAGPPDASYAKAETSLAEKSTRRTDAGTSGADCVVVIALSGDTSPLDHAVIGQENVRRTTS